MGSQYKQFKLSKLVTVCVSAIAVTIAGCAIAILVAYFQKNPPEIIEKIAKQKEKVAIQDITIKVDGLDFVLSENYGKTIRSLTSSKEFFQHKNDDAIPSAKDVDAFLKTPYTDFRFSLDIWKKNQSNVVLSIYYDADGKKTDLSRTIADTVSNADIALHSGETATIDAFTFKAGQTTAEHLKNAFEKIKKYDEVEDQFVSYEIEYKGRIIYVGLEPKYQIISIDIRDSKLTRY